MGCGSSSKPNEKLIKLDVKDCDIYGERTNMTRQRYFAKDAKAVAEPHSEGLAVLQIGAPTRPRVPNPADSGAKHQGWYGLELGIGFHDPKQKVSVTMGEKKWTGAESTWFNCALLVPENSQLISGREEVLFAGLVETPDDKNAGCIVLSTGLILVLNKKLPFIKDVYHVFDLTSMGAMPQQESSFDVQLQFGDWFPGTGPVNERGSHKRNTSLLMTMAKRQVQEFTGSLQQLSLAHLGKTPESTVPQDLTKELFKPVFPCDSGFLARVHAVCAYFGVNLNRDFRAGQEYFGKIPLLELDISGFSPLESHPGLLIAVSMGLVLGFGFRGLVCNGRKLGQNAEFLLPALRCGSLLKVHLPRCNLDARMTSQIMKALGAATANSVVDLDLSENQLSEEGISTFAEAIHRTPGGLRALTLTSCGITSGWGAKLLQAVVEKSPKLKKLDISRNRIGALPDPHPLSLIWDMPLEVLNIDHTLIDLGKVIEKAEEKKVQSLRELCISHTTAPKPAEVERFFGYFGTRLEFLSASGLAETEEVLAALLAALGRKPKSAAFKVDISSDNLRLAVGAIAKAQNRLPSLILGRDRAVSSADNFEHVATGMCQLFEKAADRALKGKDMFEWVKGELGTLFTADRDLADFWRGAAKVFARVQAPELVFSSLPEKRSLAFVLPAGDTHFKTGQRSVEDCGAGPLMALALSGLEENKVIEFLDLRGCLGGDAVGVALGCALKKNRSLRSVKIQGNWMTYHGLGAIRSSFYGNKKIVEFPCPLDEAKAMAQEYECKATELVGNVAGYKAAIKRAFKSTKGRRTPYVEQVLKEQVAKISHDKGLAAKLRANMAKYGQLLQAIQEAIDRNQKDEKNLAQDAKYKQAAWKEAANALNTISKLSNQQKQAQNSEEYEMWKRRQGVAQVWTAKCQDLKTKKKDANWLEEWIQENTTKGSLVVTGLSAEVLLAKVPLQLASLVKEEVKTTKDFIKAEEKSNSKMQSLNSLICEQKVEVAKIQASPNWRPPPPGAAGLSEKQVVALRQPVIQASVVPPRGIVQAKVLSVESPGMAAAAAAGPPSNNAPVMGRVVAVSPPTAQAATAQYDQFSAYQQQQTVYQGQLLGRVMKTPTPMVPCLAPKKHNYSRFNRQADRNAGYGNDGAMMCGMGMYMYNWDHLHMHNYYYYGHGGYHGYGWSGYDDNYYATDDCDWIGNEAMVPGDDWGTYMDGKDGPPEGMEMTAPATEQVAEAEGALNMYAGGEDDRPGKGPFGGSASNAARALWQPEPARLDFLEWFLGRLDEADKAAHEAVLGRLGRLPCCRELLVRTGPATLDFESSGVCLVTQCSVDRLGQLEAQLGAWDAEVSAAVYIEAAPDSLAGLEARRLVHQACGRAAARRLQEEGATMPPWSIVAVYQLEEDELRCPDYDRLYPVNALRNAALEAARADLVLLLDVDFLPGAGLCGLLRKGGGRLRKALSGGLYQPPIALVVPAFESCRCGMELPRDGQALRVAEAEGEVEPFHVSHFPKGHRATDFERWLRGAPATGTPPVHGRLLSAVDGVDAYPVEYEEHFEPYVVMVRALVPAYDERFRGYGLNKISHLYEVHARGFGFRTLDHEDAFAVAAKHPKSKSWRQCVGPDAEAMQRSRIATHYATFKEELHAKFNIKSSVLTTPKPSQVPAVAPAVAAQWLTQGRCARSAEDLLSLYRSETFADLGPTVAF